MENTYSDFHFKLDFHRVLELLMGERLYGDASLTLRELLQNSVDAVRYRESMEKSEGNSFSPFIKITLKGDELIIEDNGVGMDEHIFENYFMRIGRSYYNSPECRISGIEIDPISEFGIGILSVFMVASNFRVESRRKPLDPQHPPDSIYVEVPTAYDYFVRRPRSRSDIGTKITLTLKPDNPFSLSLLTKKISEIAPFIEYPVDIETTEKKEKYILFLPGDKVHDIKNIKEYFEVTFNDEKEGIEGKLRVFRCLNRDYTLNRDYIFSNQKHFDVFAQNGFAILGLKLLPERLYFNIQASINLFGKSKLSLSPNRSDVVKDERYEKLIDIIQSKILDGFENYLKIQRDSSPFKEYVKTVNELMENEILRVSKRSSSLIPQGFIHKEEELEKILKNIFLNYVPLLTISDDGQRTYKTMKNLSTPSLAIIDFNDWPEKIPDGIILKETKSLISAETVLLMHEDEGMWQRNKFLEKILGNFTDIYITSIPGVVIKAFHNDRINKSTFSFSYNDFTYQMHSDPIEKTPLFVHQPDFFDEAADNVIYNARHPLFARLLNGEKPKDEATSKAIDILIHNIRKCLWRLWEKAYSSFFRRNNGLEESVNFNYMLIGILKYYPEIFQDFYEAVELYWKEAKNLGVVSLEEDFIGFSLDDLPWFWNCELTDFKFE